MADRRSTSTGRSCAAFVEEQAPTLRRLPDTRNAIDDLRREPAAAIFAHAHSGLGASDDDALFRTILLPTLTAVAERSGGFDWQDDAFESAYASIEESLFGTARSYAAIAPLDRPLGRVDRRARRRHPRSLGRPGRALRRSGPRRSG